MTPEQMEEWIEAHKTMADLDVAGLVKGGIQEYVILIDDLRTLLQSLHTYNPDTHGAVPKTRVQHQPDGSILGYSTKEEAWIILRFADTVEGQTLNEETQDMLTASEQEQENST